MSTTSAPASRRRWGDDRAVCSANLIPLAIPSPTDIRAGEHANLEDAIRRMPDPTPEARGRRLLDALHVWLAADRSLSAGSTASRSASPRTATRGSNGSGGDPTSDPDGWPQRRRDGLAGRGKRAPTWPPRNLTYEDFCAAPADNRYELLDGELIMVPASRFPGSRDSGRAGRR